MTQLTAIDLFCGCGGLTQGLKDAGIEVVCGVDIWDKAIETYRHNQMHFGLCEDIKSLDPQDIADLIEMRNIDIIVGGPPCQGFSLAGKRDKNDPRNSLFMEYLRFVDFFKPKLVIMENVPGILSMKTVNGDKVIDLIVEEFRRIGYTVEYKVLHAADFEVPQMRKRVIFFGKPIDSHIELSHPLPVSKTHIPVKSVILTKDAVDTSYFLSEKALNGIRAKKERMKTAGNGFGAQFLDLERPCYTIPARYYKDGYDALVKYDESCVRRLTEKEVARVQTFPELYKFKGNKKDVYMQMGNAVPCKLAYHIGLHAIKLLAQQPT
jgi:DNA (cytosine-5)-methyltransferase 1